MYLQLNIRLDLTTILKALTSNTLASMLQKISKLLENIDCYIDGYVRAFFAVDSVYYCGFWNTTAIQTAELLTTLRFWSLAWGSLHSRFSILKTSLAVLNPSQTSISEAGIHSCNAFNLNSTSCSSVTSQIWVSFHTAEREITWKILLPYAKSSPTWHISMGHISLKMSTLSGKLNEQQTVSCQKWV